MEIKQLPPIKILIVTGIISMLFVALFVILLQRQITTDIVRQVEQSQQLSPLPQQQISQILPQNANSVALEERATEDFTISVPTQWSASKEDIANGQNTILRSSDEETSITIFVEPLLDQNTLRKRREFYTDLGYKESSTTVNNTKAIVFTGEVPAPQESGNSTYSVLQDTVYLVTAKDKLYLIKSHYIAGSRDQKKEKALEDIVATIRFQ